MSLEMLSRKLSVPYNTRRKQNRPFRASILHAVEDARFSSTEHKMFELTVVNVRVVHFIL